MTTTEQRRVALNEANRIRVERAKLRREVRALSAVEGRAMLADLIESPPEVVGRMLLWDMVQWPKYVGEAVASRYMRLAGVGLDRSVGQATPRQREALAACLRGTFIRWNAA